MSQTTLPAGFSIRPSTYDDIPAVVQIMNASSQAERGEDTISEFRQRRNMEMEGVYLPLNTVLIENEAGTAVAYLYFEQEEPFVTFTAYGVVHPDFCNLGIGTYLLEWAEAEARKRMVMAPPEARVVLHSEIFETNKNGRLLHLNQGFELTRSFIFLKTTMVAPPPKPNWPEGITVHNVTKELWPKVGDALEEAFIDHWGVPNEETEKHVSKPNPLPEFIKNEPESPNRDEDQPYFNSPGLIFTAMNGEQVIGSCLNNEKCVSDESMGVLGSLSVIRPWRNKGVGYNLTLHALNEFWDRGIKTVRTDTDKENFTYSYQVYFKAGFQVYKQADLYEKELRPGIDLLKRQYN